MKADCKILDHSVFCLDKSAQLYDLSLSIFILDLTVSVWCSEAYFYSNFFSHGIESDH